MGGPGSALAVRRLAWQRVLRVSMAWLSVAAAVLRPGVNDLLDGGRAVGGEVDAAAAVEVGEGLGGVALADGLADGAVVGVALADDVGEFGVAADRTVELLVPASGPHGLGLFGVAEGADDGGPGCLEEGVYARGV